MAQFIAAFEKEAGIASGIGKAVAGTAKAGRGAFRGAANILGQATEAVVAKPIKAVYRGIGGAGAEFGMGRRAVRTGKTPGDAMTASRVKRVQERAGSPGAASFSDLSAAAAGPAKDRGNVAGRFERARQRGNLVKGPSFAHRHPIATAGGAFLAGRYALGGGKQEEKQPQVSYPQY